MIVHADTGIGDINHAMMVGVVLGSVQRTISEEPESNVSIESIKTSAGISTNRLRVHAESGPYVITVEREE
jgi:hypothetical protein